MWKTHRGGKDQIKRERLDASEAKFFCEDFFSRNEIWGINADMRTGLTSQLAGESAVTLARPDGSRKVVRYDDLSTGDFASSSLRSALEGLKGIFLSPLAPPSRFAPDLLPPGTLLRRMDGHLFRVAHLEKATGYVEIEGVNEPYSQWVKIEELRYQFAAARAAAMSAGRAPVVRVLGGRWKGRRLEASAAARPTSGRARQALVNLLGTRVPGARVLDLYAGTGGVGIELVSRGAASAVLVEQEAGASAPGARADRRRPRGAPGGRRPGRPGRCRPRAGGGAVRHRLRGSALRGWPRRSRRWTPWPGSSRKGESWPSRWTPELPSPQYRASRSGTSGPTVVTCSFSSGCFDGRSPEMLVFAILA